MAHVTTDNTEDVRHRGKVPQKKASNFTTIFGNIFLASSLILNTSESKEEEIIARTSMISHRGPSRTTKENAAIMATVKTNLVIQFLALSISKNPSLIFFMDLDSKLTRFTGRKSLVFPGPVQIHCLWVGPRYLPVHSPTSPHCYLPLRFLHLSPPKQETYWILPD